jgi:hypothetical protein
MNPTSLMLHYKWKRGEEGTPLLDEYGNTVKDLDGNKVTREFGTVSVSYINIT